MYVSAPLPLGWDNCLPEFPGEERGLSSKWAQWWLTWSHLRSPCLTSPLVFPGTITQTNHLSQNPCLRCCFWGGTPTKTSSHWECDHWFIASRLTKGRATMELTQLRGSSWRVWLKKRWAQGQLMGVQGRKERGSNLSWMPTLTLTLCFMLDIHYLYHSIQ